MAILNLGNITQPMLVFGGPYSNLQATEAVRQVARKHGVLPGHVICTGDTVAYCAQPEETVTQLREWGVHVVLGNCEQALASDAPDCGCGFAKGSACDQLTSAWYPYSRQHLSQASKAWMRDLPESIRFEMSGRRIQVVHGAPSRINHYVFRSTPWDEKLTELAAVNADVIIGGHCGLPFGQSIDGRAWLNAGAIGMPANDGSRDGWYMLVKPAEGIMVSWHRLQFDVNKAYAAMQKAGLKNGYAEGLLAGLWPSMDVLPVEEQALRGKTMSVSDMLL